MIGQYHLPPVSGCTDRDLPILATLVSSHPVLATFCCILLLFTSLFDLTSLVQEIHTKYIPRPDDVGAGGKWEKDEVGSGHLGIPTAVNEGVTIRNLNKN